MLETSGKILIVDDNEKNMEICRDNLEMEDYEVFLAFNGKEGLRSARSYNPDSILLDIMMPEMDGFNILEKLKKNPFTAEIPVLIMTAGNGVDDVVKAFSLGATDHIKKPYDIEELLARVNTMVQLKKARDQLKKSIDKELYLADLGRLAGGIAHDFNNILYGIIGASEVVLDDIKNGSVCNDNYEITQELLKNVVERGNLMLSMVTGILTYVKGEKEESFQLYNLESLIVKSMNIFQRQLSGFKVETDFYPVPLVFCSARDMQQVFLNLLKNAIEAMDGKKEQRITIRLWEQGDWVKFSIADTGSGIDPENLPKIWDHLFTTKPSGSGIGLSTVKRIVMNHSGRIEIESEQGKGTKFTLCFPLRGEKPVA